ncbi:hypothetical protein C8R47DRAFT_684062 [Mycena vitilis]|nr:hypothetical protein C8R47DRAFT_684062 [Mycena vitilis]
MNSDLEFDGERSSSKSQFDGCIFPNRQACLKSEVAVRRPVRFLNAPTMPGACQSIHLNAHESRVMLEVAVKLPPYPPPRRSDSRKLINSMRGEIDATRISRILSPKEHIPGKTYDDLTGYTCAVDRPKLRAAYAAAAQKLESQPWVWKAYAKERDLYGDIANLLNRCVAASTKALRDKDKDLEGTWYQNLTFVKYDKVMGDGVGDAAALQPDLGGVDDESPAPKLYWSPPDGVKKSRMSIPVEVKGEWRELIAQAATYGRRLFSANPSHLFALVLGVNHRRKSLRFLLFHRGGLTTHTDIFFETKHGRAEVLRVLMTVLSWSEAHHAGLVSTSNELRYMLPVSADLHVKATVAKVIHHSDCVRGRATRVTRLPCKSVHNSEATVLSITSTTTQAIVPRLNHSAQSPPPSLPACQFTGSVGYQNQHSKPKEDPGPEVRTLCVTTFTTVGKPLTEAGSSDELCMALVHALLGWLSYYQSGFLQRDISIGTVLLAVGETRSKEPFVISGDIRKSQRPHWSLDEASLGGIEIEDAEPEAACIASDIMVLVGQLEINEKVTAFVVDSDMTINWKTSFKERNEMQFGTPEFMSLQLQAAIDYARPYVHSPVDDIQSFFWLAMWAVLFNAKPQTRSPAELQWQQSMRSGIQSEKSSISGDLMTITQGHSSIGSQVFPLLREWWRAQRTLAEEWHERAVPVAESIMDEVKYRDFYLHHFHVYALRGVKEFLALVVQHREKLKAYASSFWDLSLRDTTLPG